MASGKDIKKKISISLESKGSEKVQKQLDKLSKMMDPKSIAKGMSSLEKSTAKSVKQITTLNKSVTTLNQNLDKMVTRLNKVANAMNKAFRGGGGFGGGMGGGGFGAMAAMSGAGRSPFMLGMAQGVTGGEAIPERGMGRNVAGRFMGHLARKGARTTDKFGRAITHGAFGGVASTVSGLSKAAGGIIQKGVEAGQAHLNYQQNLQMLSPYLNFRGARARMAPITGTTAKLTTGTEALVQAAPEREIALQAGAIKSKQASRTANKAALAFGDKGDRQTQLQVKDVKSPEERKLVNEEYNAQREVSKAVSSQKAAARNAALRYDELLKAGADISGMNPNQSAAFIGAAMGVSGGSIDQFAATQTRNKKGKLVNTTSTGAMQTGMALNKLLGIGPESVGGFMAAERRGGISGVSGESGGANTAMKKLLADGIKAGFDNKEVKELFEMAAQGQADFARTGIEFASGTITKMAGMLGAGGLGSARGLNVAAGLTSRAQNLGQTGLTSASDFMMLRHLGGFTGGSGGDLVDTFKKLEAGDFEEGGIESLFKGITGGQGKLGSLSLARFLGTSVTEADRLNTTISQGGKLSGKDLAFVKRATKTNLDKQLGIDPEKMARADTRDFTRSLKTQANMEIQLQKVGEGIIGHLQQMETHTLKSAEAMARSQELMTIVTTTAGKIAGVLPEIASYVDEILARMKADLKN